jgi:integrase
MPIVQGRRPGQWKAYYWCRKEQKQKWAPREVTAAWDGQPFEAAEAGLERWLAENGAARVRARRRALSQADELAHLIEDFIEECRLLRPDTSENTHRAVRGHLQTYVQQYFVNTHGVKNVRDWWQHTSGFTRWLRETFPHLSFGTVKLVGQNLRRFGEYLVEEGIIRQPWRVKSLRRAAKERRITPLPRPILPAEVLEEARQLEAPMALALLLGYFTSLRPQEVYGLRREDFLTGERARKDAKTWERLAKLGLGSGLSVSVARARTRKGTEELLKTHYSYGTVNCWSAEGAQAIAALLKDLPPGPLYGETPRDELNRQWRDVVHCRLGLFLYDLRRASGLYLGRTVGADILLLQDHFRHSSIQTTLLYTRRPVGEQEKAADQNFDDVV